MSFRCGNCNEVAERPTKVVVERKMVQHTHTPGEIPPGPHGGRGTQIVREISVCTSCATKVSEAPIVAGEVIGTLGGTIGEHLTAEQIGELAAN